LTQHGYFAQLETGGAPLRFFAGARYQLAGQDRRFFSPSAGFTSARGPLRFRGAAYRAFRIPTLDELHRSFRVGNVVTYPNPALRPESLNGGEAGLDWARERTRLSLTLYRNHLDRLITNVTLRAAPNLIERQKQNAGQAIAQGLEVQLRHGWRDWTAELSYLFADSRFRSGPRLPQVAKHQGSATLSYLRPGLVLAAGLRAYSSQFEDDLNSFRMPGYAVVHLSAERSLRSNVFAVFSMENALDREFIVGFTPSASIGAPRLWRVGLRWRS
jgi:outer membrane cobalamin receptor